MIHSFDVPPGHYDVVVEAAGPVLAQARRLMPPGSFTVNVRTPEGQQNAFHGAGRSGLHLDFEGSVREVAPVTPAVRLFLAGDSTVTDQEHAPFTGWGQRLTRYFGRGLSVVNHSGSGEGSGSFLDKPELWAAMEPQLQPGDVVLVQFGHNDKRVGAARFRADLTEIAGRIAAREATPVLVTPIVRRSFRGTRLDAHGLIVNTFGVDLPAQTRRVAAELGVALIDLTELTRELVEELGPDASQALYLTREEQDDTHTSEHGASVYADLVAAGLRELKATAPWLLP